MKQSPTANKGKWNVHFSSFFLPLLFFSLPPVIVDKITCILISFQSLLTSNRHTCTHNTKQFPRFVQSSNSVQSTCSGEYTSISEAATICHQHGHWSSQGPQQHPSCKVAVHSGIAFFWYRQDGWPIPSAPSVCPMLLDPICDATNNLWNLSPCTSKGIHHHSLT